MVDNDYVSELSHENISKKNLVEVDWGDPGVECSTSKKRNIEVQIKKDEN